jgi:hypothetical protein
VIQAGYRNIAGLFSVCGAVMLYAAIL